MLIVREGLVHLTSSCFINCTELTFISTIVICCHSIPFSSCGYLGMIKGKEPESGKLREKFASSDSTLKVDDLCQMMNDFVKAAEDGNYHDLGWPSNTYVVSKVGLSALSRIQQRQFEKDTRKVWIETIIILTR